MLLVDTLAGFTDSHTLFNILQKKQKLARNRIPKLDEISVDFFFFGTLLFFPATYTKKKVQWSWRSAAPVSLLRLPHTPASPRASSTPPLACLISSPSLARALLCPRAELAHLLCLGTDFKGPGHIWLLRRGL